MKAFVEVWILATAVAQIGAQVQVTVYYESLCPDSVSFITAQLYPTYKLLKDYMNVEFVPFGKAYLTMNPWRLKCQHGRHECFGNAVQACALDKYTDKDSQMEIINCLMEDRDPPSAIGRCSMKLGFNSDEIKTCSLGDEGRHLLAQQKEKTQKFMERLYFVPSILFNGEYSREDQKDALRNLKRVICRKLPTPVPQECE